MLQQRLDTGCSPNHAAGIIAREVAITSEASNYADDTSTNGHQRPTRISTFNEVGRKRQANPAVIVETFVESMSYVWGKRSTDQTPLFARWASNTMRALYENGQRP